MRTRLILMPASASGVYFYQLKADNEFRNQKNGADEISISTRFYFYEGKAAIKRVAQITLPKKTQSALLRKSEASFFDFLRFKTLLMYL